MAHVELESISRHYGDTVAVESISIAIKSGEFLTLLGPSGCGKSTTLRILAGLLRPTGGRVLIDGRDVTALGAAKRNIGMVFQSLALFPHMTAAQNVAFGLKMRSVPEADKQTRVKRMLDVVALGGLAYRYPAEMSGGQQQRIALARALVIEPSILILDEPFGSLDRKLREAMQTELYQLTRQLGITSIFVTHDQQEALMLSDRIAVMNQGHLEQIGTPGEIFCAPATRFVADFMGATNFMEGRIAGPTDAPRIEAAGITFPAPARLQAKLGDIVNFAVRPETIALSSEEKAPQGAIRGKVRQANYYGDTSSYIVELQGGTTLVVRHRNDEVRGDTPHFPVGSAVWASWRTDAVLTFDR
jgi:spermidine/putrescine ABC transporter ATP-binding subunit